MKVAIVHDDLIQWGGAERLILAMKEIYPRAPIYTSIYLPENLPSDFKDFEIITSFMQKLPFKKHLYKFYLPFYPLAFESFDFSQYDLVISSSTRFAQGIITRPKTLHVWYCNTPNRHLWLEVDSSSISKILKIPFLAILRVWDQIASQRADFIIANSENVKKRVKKFYRRDSVVIYPFVDLDKFNSPPQPVTRNSSSLRLSEPNGLQPKDFYLIVSRLSHWKHIDLAIETFNELEWPLVIVGEGKDKARLQKMAGPTIHFTGQLTDSQLLKYYKKCRALVMTQEEDFGISALEAQACGKPVIAYKAGGALETIIAGKTGEFFYPQTKEALIKTLKNFKAENYQGLICQKNAQKFGKNVFQSGLKLFIEEKIRKHAL